MYMMHHLIGKREIKALLVKCDNVERGCEWEGTVGTLEEHVDTCDFTVVNCPKQCNKNVMRKDLKQHLEDKCPNRDYECQHCRKKDSYANITEIHYDECTMIVLPCPNSECTQTLERAQIQMHLENDCEHTVILCKYEGIGCYVKMKRKDMGAHEQDDKAHLHQALNSVVRLQDNLLSATENIESMKKDMESATETIASMKKESSAMAVKLESATETIASMKKENSAMVVMLESAKKTITSTAIKLNETVETTRVLQEKSKMTKGVIFKFRVTKYEKRKNLNEVFYTHPFYSNSNGYHMRIQVYPNGYDEDEGTHVSVYFQLVQGKYDQQLSWPFVGNVTFELLNQLADEKHHHETVSLESEDDARIGGPDWGCSQSIPHHKLPYNPIRNTQYLKDDTLYFRVSVEVEGHKPWLECTAMRN